MVKSPSCFKIITCGSDSAQNDDLELSQGKGLGENKRGWSFRKKSARHRVLSNSAANEAPPSKDGPESVSASFETEADSAAVVPEKISVVQCNDEKRQLGTFLKAEVLETAVKEELSPEVAAEEEVSEALVAEESEEDEVDAEIDESVVIVIQTAARGFLARRELLKLKKVVMLQAAFRGHIVRRHAVGTLRCVQAIVKMQALVRARRARLYAPDAKVEENLVKKSSGLNNSVEKLLGNRFARQMLESTPKTKPIHVKCDPSKPDSAWKWLERWMSASSVTSVESDKVVSVTEEPEKEKEAKVDSLLETRIEPEIICESVDSKCSSVHESVAPSESEDNLITYEADKFDFQACHYTSSPRDNLDQSELKNTSTSDVKETLVDISSLPIEDIQPSVDSQIEHRSLHEPETEAEEPKRSVKRVASEEPEAEGNKLVYVSKKANSSSFRAVQSKFEELSSAVNLGPTMSSSYQEAVDETQHDTISSQPQSVFITNETSITESPVHGSRIQVGGSECGTELSVTSTLDSPDRSDIGVTVHEPEAQVTEEMVYDQNNNEDLKNLDLAQNDIPIEPEPKLLPAIADQVEKLDNAVNGESVTPVVSMDSPTRENKPATYVASPEASPKSHITVPESQGTPSSQASVKDGKKKPDKARHAKKRIPIMKSPPSVNHDSGSRSSVEKHPKEHKSGKRLSSFGSPKPENGEQEPRDSSSSNSNSLPHFMQATESARAKLNASSSPRSSPDVQDGDNYIKKRHSLPGSNGRQGSPRIQRSTSQAQQGAKGNERKWQR